ncbi:corticotropin-releasing factor receptor 2, partial [Aplysia californica]|uniref:Corticotropin-releasing factor receptor 2 n=1 Tax=Aplysia californica TaxID=6500 RepID=A0ABM0JQ04_APLCA
MADHNETHCETWYPSISIEPGALYCPPKHDGIICWPATRANTTAYRLCIDLPRHEDDPVIPGNTQAHAHRTCLPSGEWLPYTNYSECLDAYANYSITTQLSTQPPEQDITRQAARTLSMIIFIGSTVSLVVLLLSLLIFLKFKSLQCQRTSIHKHLIMSFIIRFTIITVMVEPFVFGHNPWYKEMEWLCRTLTTIQYFSIVANFCWMLVEGLYLHLILVLRPMNNE